MSDYHQRQATLDAEYGKAYQDWIDSMTSAEREALAAQGLDAPDLPRRSTGVGLSSDAAEHRAASCLDEIAQPDPDPSVSEEDLRICEVIQRLIGELISDRNPLLAIECLAAVSGIGYQGNSLTEIAARHGQTRAAVSKRALELAERLGVKNRRVFRSDRACESYAQARIESLLKQGKTTDITRRVKPELIGMHAIKCRVAFDKLRPEWIKTASAAELLLCRRSLRPALAIADELASMIRSKNDPTITRQLEADMAAGGVRNLLA
jgi:hypothetical protein